MPNLKKLTLQHGSTGCGRLETGGCDTKLDNDVEEAFRQGHDVIFETTGQYFQMVGHAGVTEHADYSVSIAFSFVSFCNLVKQNKSRAVMSSRKYLEAPAVNPAPRLPDVSGDEYRKTIVQARDSLIKITGECFTDSNGTCSKALAHVLIYDNNSPT